MTDPCLTENGTENKEGFVKVGNNEDNVFSTFCSAASLYSFKRESGSQSLGVWKDILGVLKFIVEYINIELSVIVIDQSDDRFVWSAIQRRLYYWGGMSQ